MPAWQAREYVEALKTEDVVQKLPLWYLRPHFIDHFCDPQPIADLLTSLLPADFADLKIPLTVSATRMDPIARNVRVSDGDLRRAVLSSMSIAGVWPYVQVDNVFNSVQCSDGGTTRRYPMPPLSADPPWDAVFVLDPVSLESFHDRDRNILSRMWWNWEQGARIEAEYLAEATAGNLAVHWLQLDMGNGSCLKFNHALIDAAAQTVSKWLQTKGFGK